MEKDWNSFITGEDEINIFFEQTNCLTLYVTLDSLEKKLSFSITVSDFLNYFREEILQKQRKTRTFLALLYYSVLTN